MLGLVYMNIKSPQILLADFRAVAIKQNVFSTAVSKQENETKVILSVKITEVLVGMDQWRLVLSSLLFEVVV